MARGSEGPVLDRTPGIVFPRKETSPVLVVPLAGRSIVESVQLGVRLRLPHIHGLANERSLTGLVEIHPHYPLAGTLGASVGEQDWLLEQCREVTLRERPDVIDVVAGSVADHTELGLILGDYIGTHHTAVTSSRLSPRSNLRLSFGTHSPYEGFIVDPVLPDYGSATMGVYPLLVLSRDT